MIPYAIGAVLTVASSGGDEFEKVNTIFGQMRSRSGAKLKYTLNDVQSLKKHMPTFGANVKGDLIHYELTEPSKLELISTIKEITSLLGSSEAKRGEKKVFNIIYAGHGQTTDGSWMLGNETFSGQELHKIISETYEANNFKLHIDLILDSCYSSRFLIDFMVSSQEHEFVYPFDCVVSSLPDEKSWEMDFLKHGAMSFHLTNNGNSYVDSAELARAIDQQDFRIIVKSLQGVTVPNPVTLLTNGRQHSVILTSGHHIEVQGAGHIELDEHFGALTHTDLSETLARAKAAYGQDVSYIKH
jgi:hypothetical protein